MKAYLIPGVILTALATLLVFLATNWSTPNSMYIDFPEKLNHRVVVNPESTMEASRIEYHKDDGTRVIAEVEYTNGITSYVFYRPDGNAVAKVLDFYPADSLEQSKRQLKGETHFSADGKNLAKHVAYRIDGTVERRGQRMPDNSYMTLYIADDGVRVEKERLFDQYENLVSEVAYFEDGSVKLKTEKSGYTLKTTTYREDGTKFSEVENGGYSSTHKGVFFWEDGVTVKNTFESYSWRLEVGYHNHQGVLEYEVSYYDDRMEVDVISPQGKVVFEQKLKLVSGQNGISGQCDGTYALTQVTEYHMFGTGRNQSKTKRIIEFTEDGSVPVRVIVPTSNSLKYTYTLDANGVVVDIKKEGTNSGYGSGGAVTPAVSYRLGDKVDIDPVMVESNSFECLTIPEKLKTETPVYYPYGPF